MIIVEPVLILGFFGRGSLTEAAGKLKEGKQECQQKGNGRRSQEETGAADCA